MNKVVVITIESPDADPDTVTFEPPDVTVEQHPISTYAFSRYNTEGIWHAAEQLTGWLNEARTHWDERVRAWYLRFTQQAVTWQSDYDFHIDWDRLVLIAYREQVLGSNSFEWGPWSADEDTQYEAMRALTWSYKNDRDHIEEYAAYALRAWALATYPDDIVASVHLDFHGDGTNAMFVTGVEFEDGTFVHFDSDTDDDEPNRAASDMLSTRLLTRPGVAGPYRLAVQPMPWVVTDGRVAVGEQTPVLGRFATQELASKFIETLPDHLEGRYGLDGPDE